MPPAVLGVAAGVGANLLGAKILGSILIGAAVFYQAYSAERLQRQLRQGLRQRSTRTIRAPIESAKWRFGITRCFGMLSQIAWQGDDLQYTLVIGEAPIKGVEKIWINGRGMDIAGTDGASIEISADDALGEGGTDTAIRLDFYLGEGAVDTTRMLEAPWKDEAEGLRWTADMKFQGLAICVVYVKQNEDRSWWRGIPEIEFRTTGYMYKGKELVNAAEVRRWWEIERERETEGRIDGAFYGSAVGICSAGDYEINGTIDAADDIEATRAALDFAWDGTVVEFNGLLRFMPGAARAQVLTIPRDDIVELPVIRPGPDLHARVNRVEIQLHQCESADWQPQSMPPIEDAASQAAVGGVLPREYSNVEYITKPAVATRIGRRQMFEGAGMSADIVVPFGTAGAPFKYLELAPGTIVGCDAPGMSGKRFRIGSTGPGENDTLVLGLVEELPQRYTAAGGVPLPPPYEPPDIEPPDTDSLAAPEDLKVAFHALLTSGNVVTNVVVSGGKETSASGAVTLGNVVVESERELVVTWKELADEDDTTSPPTLRDPAIGFHIVIIEDQDPDGPSGEKVVLTLVDAPLPRSTTEYRRPYRPLAKYSVTLYRVLTADRRGKEATAEDTAPADRTRLP